MSLKSRRRRNAKFGKRKFNNDRRNGKQSRLANSYASLEPRHLLAFSMLFDAGTLTLTQTVDDGTVVIDNNGAANAFQVTDGAGTVTHVAATNLVVNLLDRTAYNQLEVGLPNAHSGYVELNLGDGELDVGIYGAMDGDLTIQGGSDYQVVRNIIGLTVGGNVAIDLGSGNDTFQIAGATVTGNIELVGVNNVFLDSIIVDGSVSSDVSGESETSNLQTSSFALVGGDLTITGGDGTDIVDLLFARVDGNMVIDVGDNTAGPDAQRIFISESTAGMNLTVTSTNAAFDDLFSIDGFSNVGGDISVDLGDGVNNATIGSEMSGAVIHNISYHGGVDSDTVFLSAYDNDFNGEDLSNVNIVLGAGDDTFTLETGDITETTLRVDFGGGVDQFNNNWGSFGFNASFLNWDGFNRFYSNALDQWHMFEVVASGDITLSEQGDIWLTNTYMTTMPHASTLRLTMLDNTGNVDVDLGYGVGGDVILELNNGDRNVHFIGNATTIGGNLFIEAANGAQHIDLAVDNSLYVDGSAVMNLRDGVDNVDHNNDLNVNESLILRGVNVFENTTTMNVGSLLMNSTFFDEPSRLDNDGSMNIRNSLIYIGGDEKDDVTLGGANIGGNASINVGSNLGLTHGQTVNLGDNFNADGNVFVTGGESLGGNAFLTNYGTTINGFIVVNFSANSTNNLAVFDGHLDNFGLYKGGSGQDVVTVDAEAEDLDLFLQLGDGDDTVNLFYTRLNSLFANFGAGDDTLVDHNDTHPFLTTFWNLENTES